MRLPVYLLLGQSNMEGHGLVGEFADGVNGSLAFAATHAAPPDWPTCTPAEAAANRAGCDAAGADFSMLLDANGTNWTTSTSVFVDYQGNVDDAWGTVNRGYLAPGFGFAATSIGPELGFGHTITRDGEAALLLKVAWGGTALATDWRPPRSAANPTPFCPDCTEVGWCYRNMTQYVHAALANLSAVFPDYDAERGYELVGWAWHQGWNDGCGYNQSYEYEYNLANLIRDLDDEFAAETRGEPLKVAIAVQGTSGGWDGQPDRRLEVLRAQYNVSQHAEFAGRVAAVETRGFWRDFDETSEGPCGQDYHWNCNAASYFFIGTAAGQAMVGLEDGTWVQPFINATNDHGALPPLAGKVEDACSVR